MTKSREVNVHSLGAKKIKKRRDNRMMHNR
jgi:hypothetical protein